MQSYSAEFAEGVGPSHLFMGEGKPIDRDPEAKGR